MDYTKKGLFSPIKLRNIELKNRITVSSMCMYSSQDGFSNNWHMVHIGSRAVGGAGLILTEATAVSPEARITPDDLGIWRDEHIEGLRDIVDFAASQGAVTGVQLAHAGRKASTTSPWKGYHAIPSQQGGWKTMGPSAIPFNEGEEEPLALDQSGIDKVIGDFRSAAKRSLEAGFQIVEIHAAHGYLLHQFLSPLSNHRTDHYGGSFENRIRLLMEVTDAVREVWPENLPLFTRISATDWVEGGWNQQESVELSRLLGQRGVDLIDCSSGGLVPDAQIPVEKEYQVRFSEKIKSEAGIMTGAVGLITDPKVADQIILQQRADIVLIAREFLRNPYFPLEAASALEKDVNWPPQYERARYGDR